jgi:hypothetical protein
MPADGIHSADLERRQPAGANPMPHTSYGLPNLDGDVLVADHKVAG